MGGKKGVPLGKFGGKIGQIFKFLNLWGKGFLIIFGGKGLFWGKGNFLKLAKIPKKKPKKKGERTLFSKNLGGVKKRGGPWV